VKNGRTPKAKRKRSSDGGEDSYMKNICDTWHLSKEECFEDNQLQQAVI